MINKLKGKSTIDANEYLTSLPVVAPNKQAKLYSSYVLSLASTSTNHTDVLKNPLKIINLRNFEIPMSGGIEICKYNPELAEYFREDKEILFYRTNEELVDKAKYYLEKATESEIQNMKDKARKRSEEEHTWMCRFKKIFAELNLTY